MWSYRCGEFSPSIGWTFTNYQRFVDKGPSDRLFLDTNGLITPYTQFRLRAGTVEEALEIQLIIDENANRNLGRKTIVPFSIR